MSKDVTSPYAVQIFETPPPGRPRSHHTPSCWFVRDRPAHKIKGHGKPTDANLEKYVMTYAKSLHSGGANQHLSKIAGYIPYPTSAEIRENRPGGKVVATWKAAMFQVF